MVFRSKDFPFDHIFKLCQYNDMKSLEDDKFYSTVVDLYYSIWYIDTNCWC